jgi:hypothetical protein
MQTTHWLNVGVKRAYWLTAGILSCLVLGGTLYAKSYSPKPETIAHTPEYDAVVDEHIDLSKISRDEVDRAATKEEVGQRFAVYLFDHPSLRGKWGDLYVIVDRQTGKSTSRSLWKVQNTLPSFTLAATAECVTVNQPGQNNHEICVR